MLGSLGSHNFYLGKIGRENDEERIIAYNIGIALHDMYYAGKIFDMISHEK